MGFDLNKEDESKGFSLDKDSDSNKKENSSKPKGNNKLIFIILGVIAVIIFFVFMGNDSNGGDSSDNVATEDTGAEDTRAEDTGADETVADETVADETVADETVAEDTSGESKPANDKNNVELSKKDFTNKSILQFSKASASSFIENKKVSKIIKFLKDNPNLSITIKGFASSEGRADVNMKLSKQRADKFASILKRKGVSSDRMKIVAMGIDNPIADNNSEQGRKKNRRVEIEFK